MEADNMEVEQETAAQDKQEEVEKVATTAFLSRIIVTRESIAEETEPFTFTHTQKIMENIQSVISFLGEVFNQRVQEGQQALITCYLQPTRTQQPREVEVPVQAEGSSEHGNQPDPQALANLMLDEDFSGFVEEDERQASGENQCKMTVPQRCVERSGDGDAGGEERGGGGSGGAH